VLKPAFIDISHWQVIPASLEAAAASGILGVVHKATEGATYVDPKLEARHHLADDAGLMWGVYHFMRPGSIAAQARHFLHTVEPLMDDDTLLMADHEDAGVSLDELAEFLALVAQATGRMPALYSGHLLKEQLAGKADARLTPFRLWIAQYADAPVLPPGWPKYWAWQYTQTGRVPGIEGDVDLNAYDGPADGLIAEWSGLADVMPPAPGALVVDVAITAPAGVRVNVRVEEA
jgi:lysozyme